MTPPTRRHLALMLPSDNGYMPCMGVIELHDTKVVTSGIADQHLPEWIKAIDAERNELKLRSITLSKTTDNNPSMEGAAA
jgi:hypothetical protein